MSDPNSTSSDILSDGSVKDILRPVNREPIALRNLLMRARLPRPKSMCDVIIERVYIYIFRSCSWLDLNKCIKFTLEISIYNLLQRQWSIAYLVSCFLRCIYSFLLYIRNVHDCFLFRYSKDDPFIALTIDIRNHQNLIESLDQFVKGDLLEGANAYHCDKCNKKVGGAIHYLCGVFS